jgi:subtilisin family serine protease
MPTPRIEWSEQRLALSASLAVDWMIDALNAAYCLPNANVAPPATTVELTGILAPGIAPAETMGPQIMGPEHPSTQSLPHQQSVQTTNHVQSPLSAAAAIRDRFGIDGRGQTVAVIDTGIAWDHYAFSHPNPNGRPIVGLGAGFRVVGGWDFAENDANPYDDGPAGYHGTHVAGIVGANYGDHQGVAPGVDLVGLRVFNDRGAGRLDWIESALQWVIDNRNAFENPITTVNLSLGVFADASAAAITRLDDELAQLRDHGILVVAAAGNSFTASRPDWMGYPASHPLVAAVSSVDTNGMLSSFSQRDDGVFAAPGRSIISSVPEHVNGFDGRNDDFQPATGTSMAAPQVAAAGVLVRQAMETVGIEATPEAILNHLRQTSQTLTDAVTGAIYHRIDLYHAIDTLLGNFAPPPGGSGEGPDPLVPSHLQWTADRTLVVNGTNEASSITVDLSTHVRITVDSVVYAIDRPVDHLIVQGGGGANSLEIISSGNGGDRVILRAANNLQPSSGGVLHNTRLSAIFNDFQTIRYVGTGGNDRVTMFDSPGNDTFESSPQQAILRGTGFTFIAQNVPNVFAHGTSGGIDTAYLYDSVGNDTLAIRHQFTSLRGEGMFRLAYGFERVYAFATNGGFNQAFLYDSPGDDTMSATPAGAVIAGRDYYAGARGFDVIRAEATAGGNDVARLFAAGESAQWSRAGSLLQMIDSNGQTRSAQGFRATEGFVAGSPLETLPSSLRSTIFEEERLALQNLFAEIGRDFS